MKRVLLVEDNYASALLICDYLLGIGWLVTHAADGDGFLDKVRACEPQIIVLDWLLPATNGLELLQALRQEPELRHIPAVVISAAATRRQREQALAAGANDYLLKPFSFEKLTSVLEQLAL